MDDEILARLVRDWTAGELGDDWLGWLAPVTLMRLWRYFTEKTIADFKPRIRALEAAMRSKGVWVPVSFENCWREEVKEG